jgi:hypothetical protein
LDFKNRQTVGYNRAIKTKKQPVAINATGLFFEY